MSQRNAISQTLAARLDSLMRSSRIGLATGTIELVALGVVCLMYGATGLAVTLGGLLPAGVLALKRASNQPTRCPLEPRRLPVHPAHIVDRNHR